MVAFVLTDLEQSDRWLILDDGGDATLLIHRGFQAEDNPTMLDEFTDNKELRVVNLLLKRIRKETPGFWHEVVKN